MLLHFALVLHFAEILITFSVNITFCGDYYILRRNTYLHAHPISRGGARKKYDVEKEVLGKQDGSI